MYWAEAVWCVVYPTCVYSKLCEFILHWKITNFEMLFVFWLVLFSFFKCVLTPAICLWTACNMPFVGEKLCLPVICHLSGRIISHLIAQSIQWTSAAWKMTNFPHHVGIWFKYDRFGSKSSRTSLDLHKTIKRDPNNGLNELEPIKLTIYKPYSYMMKIS